MEAFVEFNTMDEQSLEDVKIKNRREWDDYGHLQQMALKEFQELEAQLWVTE
jgi:hypothetical protein